MRAVALLGAAVAAAVVLMLGLAQGWWRGGAGIPPLSRPLVATASLSARTVDFGDPLTARLELLVDPRRVDPDAVRVKPRFAPYRVSVTALRTRTAHAMLLSYRFALECLTPACVPGRVPAERRFLSALVSFRTRSGRSETRPVEWPSFELVSRLTDADRADPTARLRVDSTLPPVTYRIDPGTLQALLIAFSAALVLLASALTALALRRRARPPAPVAPDLAPLDRALLFVHASTANGFPDDRRKALSRLARELRASGRDDLANAAARLAWSADAPSPEAAGEFASEVEAALGEEA